MQKYFTILFLFFTTLLLSQTGRISGTILDSKTGESLPGATILIEGSTRGASADFDGNFSINNVPAGKVNLVIAYISYTSKKIEGVIVVANDATSVNIQLEPSTSQDLMEVEVVVTLNKENNTALVLQQKNNASVSDGISAETIRRTPDKNTSDVLKRVSGASIQDNKFAVIRGLNERYNAAYLNGAPLPSSESDRKAFAFDIFPSNMLDNLVITKTARPDMPGEFAGGIIDVSTKSIPEKNFVSLSLSSGYNTQTTFKQQYYYKGGKTDWLGYDDGTRKMPDVIPSIKDYPDVDKKAQAKLAQDVNTGDWGTYNKKFSPNSALQLAAGYNIKYKERDFLGVLASLSYNKTNSFTKAVRNSISDNNDVNRPSQLDAVFNDDTYSESVLIGALLNLTCKLNSNNTISSKNLYSLNSEDRTIIRSGEGSLHEPENATLSKTNGFWYTSNKIASSQLIGDHYLKALKVKIAWVGSYSDVKREVPALRRNTYSRLKNSTNPDDTVYKASISPSSVGSDYGGYMFWSNLNESNKSIKADITRSFKISPKINIEVKGGGFGQARSRDFTARQFGYTKYEAAGVVFTQSLVALGDGEIFNNQNMGLIAPGSGGFKLNEGTKPRDSYLASSKLNAGYLMADFKYNQWFRAIFGARIESYHQTLVYKDERYKFNGLEITKDTTVVDMLPSANFIFSLNSKQNIRVGYSQTLNRPEFRELAPFAFYDFTTLFLTTGNDTLKRALIKNYDLRYEIYPGSGQLFSTSVFYKHFDSPIEQVASVNKDEITYINAPEAKCYGFELEYRIILGTFMKNDSSAVGKILNNTTLFSNFAYIKSSVDVSTQSSIRPGYPGTRALQGQSPYLFNAGLMYVDNDKGYSLSAIVNRVGQRINVVGNYEAQLDIWESGRTALDLQVSKSFFKNKLEVRITARDVLAKWQLQYYYNKKDPNANSSLDKNKDDIIRTIRYGTTYSFQLTYKF
ncbi:TonB-dependent receptor [Aurantibacillus circumpalustris]|uniref:TonB-dependent receptor n=1 Tax=Aurantibacillus circumpalustris TaxID=3036359 RepID=UPI00295B1930|nr:outer membrane beta-barrel protein [Aurantibacillus circumpalustris]